MKIFANHIKYLFLFALILLKLTSVSQPTHTIEKHQKVEQQLQQCEQAGKNGNIDSLKYLSKKTLHKIEKLNCTHQLPLLAKLHTINANYGPYTEDNQYRISERKEAIQNYKELKHPEELVCAYLFLSRDFMHNKQTDSALFYLDIASQIEGIDSTSINLARCYTMEGNIQNQIGKFTKAIHSHKNALSIITAQPDSLQKPIQLAVINSNISGAYIGLEKFNHALEYGIEALKHTNAPGFPYAQRAITLTNVGCALFNMREYERAIPIFEEIVENQQKFQNTNIVISALNNLTLCYQGNKKALQYVNRAERLIEKYNATYYKAKTLNAKAITLINLEKYEEAIKYFNLAINEDLKTGNTKDILKAKAGLLDIYHITDQYNKIYKVGHLALEEAMDCGYWYDAQIIANSLIEASKELNKPDLMYQYLQDWKAISDSINKINSNKAFLDLSMKFETQQKEQKIELLEAKSQNQELRLAKIKQEKFITLTCIAILVLLIIPIEIYNRQRNKNKVLKAQIDSSNRESTRIAKELHDSISGSLTTILYAIKNNNNQENLVSNIEAVSRQVRGISYKLNTNILAEQSLKEAIYHALMLNQFPENIKLSINLPDNFEIENFELKINLIRTLQELVQNTIKHAEASQINVQFETLGDKIKLHYSDNGKGCNLAEIKHGSGIKNIYDRINFLKGDITLDSSENMGFYCLLEVEKD